MRRIASSVLATIKEQEMILYSETRPIFCTHLKQAAKKIYTSKNNAYIFSLSFGWTCNLWEFEFRRNNMDLRNDGVVETEDDLDGIRERTYQM